MWEQYIVLHFPNCQKNCVQQLLIFILFRHFSPKSSVKFKSIYCSSTLTSNVQHVVSEFGVDPKLLGENCKKNFKFAYFLSTGGGGGGGGYGGGGGGGHGGGDGHGGYWIQEDSWPLLLFNIVETNKVIT